MNIFSLQKDVRTATQNAIASIQQLLGTVPEKHV